MTWWNDYVGIPYCDGGRDRDGVDCAGLVCLVYKEQFKINVDDHFDPYIMDAPELIAQKLTEVAQKQFVPTEHPKDGDVVLMWMLGTRSHVGILCDGGKAVMHVQKGMHTAIVSKNHESIANRIDSFWRRPE